MPIAGALMWANQYVGMQFEPNGRARPRLDCWGLYRLVLLEQRGITLPLWSMVDAENLRAVYQVLSEQQDTEQWVHVHEAKEFDLVLMRGQYKSETDGRLRSGPVHIGCVAGPDRVLHIEVVHGSVLSHMKFMQPRILGFYRHRDLAA